MGLMGEGGEGATKVRLPPTYPATPSTSFQPPAPPLPTHNPPTHLPTHITEWCGHPTHPLSPLGMQDRRAPSAFRGP